ncbi:MAG: hypothetical protein US94_C0006G0004 [Berkelbacteria bacterium GW2011_GWB1_38_5]|uniref:Uncharacterized protein n=2 Tax=Candidatus Berkelbacteria TaxID=1618330 RepID=A0A0G0LRS6_9BACT|nr:MAG: hypothetical protein US94_C0006G0004 [Berkelbacteria bacterium GW2011_GWB1_38_5]KKQ90670.1 MAG: hypothetical protein UT15_C0007G0002 [Berkelbacteria bacterium GW2011_GWA1_39_10]
MGKLIPRFLVKTGIPVHGLEHHDPQDYQNFGPDDIAGAVGALIEACKLLPDDFLRQIDMVEITWVGYFRPDYLFIIREHGNNTLTSSYWTIKDIESRFDNRQEIITIGHQLASKLIKQIRFFYERQATEKEVGSTLAEVVAAIPIEALNRPVTLIE